MKPLAISMLVLLLVAATATGAAAQNGRQVRGELEDIQEVPALSTLAHGNFRGTISKDGEELSFKLSYEDLVGEVQQAHLHFGQAGVNGGIAIFLCTNLGNGPAGTQPCPPPPAEIEGTLSAEDVIGPAGQGIDPAEWEEVIRALREGVVYANVHTDTYMGGEIRGQLRVNQRRDRP